MRLHDLEAPDHLVNRCAVDPLYWDVFPPARELNLQNYGLRTIVNDPPLAYLHPDGSSIAFFNDPRRTAEDIRRFSHADAQAWLEFVSVLDGFGAMAIPLLSTNPVRPQLSVVAKVAYNALRHARRLPDMGFMSVATADEIVQERFEHPVVKAALLANTGQVTNNQVPTSGLGFIQLAMLHRGPTTTRPVGGVQAICDALGRRLQSKAAPSGWTRQSPRSPCATTAPPLSPCKTEPKSHRQSSRGNLQSPGHLAGSAAQRHLACQDRTPSACLAVTPRRIRRHQG